MGLAEHCEVAEVSAAAVDPMNDVVHLAPPGRAVAAGEAAPLVAKPNGCDLRWFGKTGLPTEVKERTVGSENCGDDARVAGKAADA